MFRSVVISLALLGVSAAPPASCVGRAGAKPTGKDMHRAHSTVQGARVGGKDHKEIAAKINHALSLDEAPQKECGEFSLSELNQLIRDMTCHFSDHLNKAYGDKDGRRRRFETLSEYEQTWAEELSKVEADPSLLEPLLHAKCAETLMLWTHHVPSGSKDTLVNEQSVTIPTLPAFNETHAVHEDDHVAKTYASSYTCQTGHGMTEATTTGSDHVLPHWNTNHHYMGTGYGAYPFWAGGDGSNEHGDIEVWWSEEQAAELFYHKGCYMNEVGYGTGSTPCYHLMTGVLGEAKGYLYSADGNFCCESTGKPEDLAAPQSDFMDDMTFEGTYTVETAYYSGDAYWYTETLGDSEAVSAFWYATTPDGYPLQQGEGGYGPNSPSGKGIFIYHEYNYTTWKAEAGESIDESIFEIPSICKTTSNKCQFP